MKFIVQQTELSRALNMLNKAVATRTSIDVLKGIFFKTEENSLFLASNNLEIGIQTEIPCEVEQDGQLVIEGNVITDIMKKMPKGEVTFETANSVDYIQVRSENTNFSIKYIPCTEFPLPEYIDENLYVDIDAEAFSSSVIKTGYAISKNEDKPLYMSHFIKVNGKDMIIFTIDGFRVALIEKNIFDLNLDEKTFIVQGKILMDIAGIISSSENVKFAYDDKHISILCDNTTITTSLVLGQFLDYKSLIPKSFNSTVVMDIKDLKDAIDRVSLISSNRLIVFETSGNMMKISSRDDTVGEAVGVIDVDLEGENFKIGFNSLYIIDAIKNIESANIVLKVIDEVSACIISPENEPEYINLVLPVRMR